MNLFMPQGPVDPSWSHFRHRRDCLKALFPPLLPPTFKGDKAKPSLELLALQRDITRFPPAWRVNSGVSPIIPIEWTDSDDTYNTAFSAALVVLDALSIDDPIPYAADAAFAAWTVKVAEKAFECEPCAHTEDYLERSTERWRIFQLGYGCVGVYDGAPWTYLLVRGDTERILKIGPKKRPKKTPKHSKFPEFPEFQGNLNTISSQFPMGERELIGAVWTGYQFPVPELPTP